MEDLLKVWLTSTNISNEVKKYIYNEFNTFETFSNVVFKRNISAIKKEIIEKLITTYEKLEEDDTLGYMDKNHIHISTIDEEEYPRNLRNYTDSPFGMFYKGDISKINKNRNIAIVGSRRCTRYGIDVTNSIVNKLVSCDLNIISGMAKGIDSIAHGAAINNNISTVAILGSGIDVIYPKVNLKLYDKILEEEGCIISEFPIGMEPLSRNFPVRNRIISGISDLLIIVEGGEKSGTLITAGAALEQGKDIVVVPGSIFSNESKGTNKLIRDGAYIYTDIDDVLSLLNISRISMDNNIEKSKKGALEEKIYKIIDDNPIHIDNIIKLVDIDINQLYKLLFELQVKEEILCLSGNFYVRINKC